MVTSAGQLALFALGVLLAVCQALENTTSSLSANPPMAAAVVSYFNDCPDSHSQLCFHGTCRFLVQEDKPACVCHTGYIGARCEHADLLAVVAASQKKQAITALVVVSIVALAGLIITCVLIHCCQVRKHCEWCRALVCRHEKPSALLKGRTACCHSETVVWRAQRRSSARWTTAILIKKELLQDSPATDALGVQQTFLFCLHHLYSLLSFVGLPSIFYQELCLLGVIRCDLEKKSVDRNLKTGEKWTARGGLPIYPHKVCASASVWVQVYLSSTIHGCQAVFLVHGPTAACSLPSTEDSSMVVTTFSHPLIGEEGGERVTAHCYMRMPTLRRAVPVLCPQDPQPAQYLPQTYVWCWGPSQIITTLGDDFLFISWMMVLLLIS